MKIRYLSDLHLEFIKPPAFSLVERAFGANFPTDVRATSLGLQRYSNFACFIRKIPPGSNEVAVLAGDVGSPRDYLYGAFMEYMNLNFKRTFVIAGNHEYYGSSMPETDNILRTELKRFANIRFLQNEFEIYEDHCFLGTTLWSKITNPQFEINDTSYIHGFSSSECTRLNTLNKEWLKGALENNKNCVVITHHMPSERLIDEKYKTLRMQPYNQWFCCDLDELILQNKDKIKCWIYGHTHTPSVKKIGGVPMLCNPVGYPGENSDVDFSKNIVLR